MKANSSTQVQDVANMLAAQVDNPSELTLKLQRRCCGAEHASFRVLRHLPSLASRRPQATDLFADYYQWLLDELVAKGRDNFINIRSFATEVFGACKSQSAFEAQESIARAQDLDRMEKLGRDFRIASCAQRIVCNLLEFGIAFRHRSSDKYNSPSDTALCVVESMYKYNQHRILSCH